MQTTNVVDIPARRIFVERKCPVKDPRMIPLRAPTTSPFRMNSSLNLVSPTDQISQMFPTRCEKGDTRLTDSDTFTVKSCFSPVKTFSVLWIYRSGALLWKLSIYKQSSRFFRLSVNTSYVTRFI